MFDLRVRLVRSAATATACVLLLSCSRQTAPPAALPPFPADDPASWVCAENQVPEQEIRAWCSANPDRGQAASLTMPVTSDDLAAKNAYDAALQQFLRNHEYRSLGWVGDSRWRLTGPYVGELGNGKSFGVHPAVRVWYSPEIVDWLCNDRQGGIPDGAMIVKEMHDIDASLGIEPAQECMRIDKDPAEIDPTSWTVMVRSQETSADGWYWANPSASVAGGNPPILDRTAVTSRDYFTQDPRERNPNWFPTGDLFGQFDHLAGVVTPYSLFGGLCINCHASAVSGSTFSTLSNVIGEGLQYRHYRPDTLDAVDRRTAGTEHEAPDPTMAAKPDWGFSHPLEAPAPAFASFFGDLGPHHYADALDLRLPAETWDHQVAKPGDDPGPFLTSDQCMGCHDATISNAGTPNMLIPKPGAEGIDINVSPYAEWRASPMGLAGRDPIFFSQLQSETNNLPELTACIENTCLHCHGVMGQRTFSMDTERSDAECKDLFVDPPADVPFGDPFRLSQVTRWQNDGNQPARYGDLARDGISCTVCHHISDDDLDSENRFTGNFPTGPNDEFYGPYEDVVEKPMQHALGTTPKHGAQIKDSALCSTCHNILLPVLSNQGQPIVVGTIDGQALTHSYEQTTGLEWQNSKFAQAGSFESCQDCHLPHEFGGEPVTPIEIANIESNEFAPTDNRLPDPEITLTPRKEYGRHALHGLNLFLNQMFQQFPVILGIRQIDYAGSIEPSTQPALVTAAESMTAMATEETAELSILQLDLDPSGRVVADVRVLNRAGHYLPSGVGFRRVFLEFVVEGRDGLLWASGRTNGLGVILDGTSDRVLDTEYGADDSTAFQPHYETITAGDQVQIYQELIKDSDGILTTSFLRRAHTVKDNRLRPEGFDVAFYAGNASPYIQLLAEELRGLPSFEDPDYSNPDRTGADHLRYEFELTPAQVAAIERVTVRLYNQSIPPFYLQQRFNDAPVGPGRDNEIKRLYYLTSHLNTDASTPIENWKVLLARDCRDASGQPCGPPAAAQLLAQQRD
ncbi:MAG: hypothetical protein AAGE01_13075 [Pseudomonadota bacterium]